MVDPVSAGIGAVVAAFSKPIEKLIDVTASGMGTLYAPRDIRNRARAEADALVILEEGRQRAAALVERATQRLESQEARRQENLEAIIENAKKALPDEVSTTPVEPDWTARFFREAQDVSDETMRVLWGKLLAGEVTAPGSFSPRTLAIVSTLTRTEAETFRTFCGLTLRVAQVHFPVVMDVKQGYLHAAGLTYQSIMGLEAAGLVHYTVGGTSMNPPRDAHFLFGLNDVGYKLNRDQPSVFPLGECAYTEAGKELMSLAEPTPIAGHEEALIESWLGAGWRGEKKRVVRVEENKVHFRDWTD